MCGPPGEARACLAGAPASPGWRCNTYMNPVARCFGGNVTANLCKRVVRRVFRLGPAGMTGALFRDMAREVLSVRVELASGLVSNRLVERRGGVLVDADGETVSEFLTTRPATAREARDWSEDQEAQAGRVSGPVVVKVRFYTLGAKFAKSHDATYETEAAAFEAVEAYAAPHGFSRFKRVNDEDFGYRITGQTPGGRGGRNIAFVEVDDECEQ